MHSASGAGVEAVNGTQRVDRLLHIGNGHADESLLQRAIVALRVVRREIPRGRNDDLVIGDLAALDLLGMVESATRGLPETGAFASGGLRTRCLRRRSSRERGSTQSRRS